MKSFHVYMKFKKKIMWKNSGVGHASEQQEARLKGREQLQARALANRQQQVSQTDRMKRAAAEEVLSTVQAELGLVTTRSAVQGPSIHSRMQQQQQHKITGEQGSIQRHEFINDLAVLQRRHEERERDRGRESRESTRKWVRNLFEKQHMHLIPPHRSRWWWCWQYNSRFAYTHTHTH